MLDRIEVPAISSFSHDATTWWGERSSAEGDKEAKSLWRRVDKSRLPDKTIALPFPGAPGCTTAWQAHTQSLVDEYNSGELPEHFIHLGKWPEEVGGLFVYPGLLRVAKQHRAVLRAPRQSHTCTARGSPWLGAAGRVGFGPRTLAAATPEGGIPRAERAQHGP